MFVACHAATYLVPGSCYGLAIRSETIVMQSAARSAMLGDGSIRISGSAPHRKCVQYTMGRIVLVCCDSQRNVKNKYKNGHVVVVVVRHSFWTSVFW